MIIIGRRELFIALVGAGAAWPFLASAQQADRLPTIGFLGTEAAAWTAWTAAFVERLRTLGWTEGRTVRIEYRWFEGRAERAAEIAAEFVRSKVDIIVTAGNAVAIAKQATSDIPIVFALLDNPVAAGLVKSLARPGGNLTGLSLQATDVAGKRLDVLREVVPHLRRLAIMLDVGFAQNVAEAGAVEATARALGIDVVPLEIRRPEDIAPAFESLNGQADALYIVPGALTAANSTRIITFTLSARLPTIFSTRERVRAGALISYGPDNKPRSSGALPNSLTRFCAGPNPAISRLSSRQSSSSSSISPPPGRLGSQFRRRCSPLPTR